MSGCFYKTMKLKASLYKATLSGICSCDIVLASDGEALHMCEWNIPARVQAALKRHNASLEWGGDDITERAAAQLDEYFAGRRKCFSVPLKIEGTSFMKAVWEACSSVPYGFTASYSELAAILGKPKAARAVGNALAANCLSLFIPCHRIVGASGPGNYAGGSDAKFRLLQFEKNCHYDLSQL